MELKGNAGLPLGFNESPFPSPFFPALPLSPFLERNLRARVARPRVIGRGGMILCSDENGMPFFYFWSSRFISEDARRARWGELGLVSGCCGCRVVFVIRGTVGDL